MTTQCKPSEIIVGKRMRPLNAERVADLERSIGALGLQHLITVRYTDNKPTPLSAVDHARQAVLIAGAHRLQAVKNLGWSEIPIREFDGDDRAARMWEIAENLHRSVKTIVKHRSNMMRKLSLHDASAVTRFAIAHGLLSP